MKQLQVFCIIVLAIMNIGYSQSDAVHSPQLQSSSSNLDVLFLIDRSSSMGGDLSYPKPNDPLGLRFYGPVFAMQWMGSDHLLVHNDITYNMAVIQFGSTPQSGLNWQTIAPSTQDEWVMSRKDLESQLSPGDRINQSLGDTNFVGAFTEAWRYFQDLNKKSSISSDKKVIIILTDGAPYVDTSPGGGTFSIGTHMGQVQDLVDRHLSPQDGYSIYVVSLQDPTKNIWALMQPYWDKIARGNDVQVSSSEEIGAYFQKVLIEQTANLTQNSATSDETVVPGKILVNPFVQSLTFTVFKSSLDQKYSILLPDNTDLLKSNANYSILGSDGPIETISLTNPPPGYWTFSVETNKPIRIRMRQVFGKGVLILPQGNLTENIPSVFEFSLLGIDGKAIPDYNSPLNFSANVTLDGKSTPIDFLPVGEGQYHAEFIPQRSGEYQLEFNASSVNGAATTVDLLDQKTVLNVKPISFEITPKIDTLDLFVPLKLEMVIRDAYNRPLSELPNGIEFDMKKPDSSILPLVFTPTSGKFISEYLPVEPGNYTVIAKNNSGSNSIDNFEVIQPIIRLGDFPNSVYAYTDNILTLQLNGNNGDVPAWSGTGNYVLVVDAKVGDVPVDMNKISEGNYTITYRPTKAGSSNLKVLVGIKDTKSDFTYPLVDKTFYFVVNNSTPIKINADPSYTQAWQSFSLSYPPLKEEPWEISLTLVGLDGKTIDPNNITTINLSGLFDINVYEGSTKINSNITTTYVGNGKFLISGPTLKKGDYVIRIDPKPVLLPGYVWLDSQLTSNLVLVENPVIIIAQVLIAILILALLYRALLKVITDIRAKNPCVGYLAFIDVNNRVIWSKNLADEKSSYIRFAKKDLGMFPGNEIAVTNIQNSGSSNPTIRVKYRLNSGIGDKIVLSIPSMIVLKVKTTESSFLYSMTDPEAK